MAAVDTAALAREKDASIPGVAFSRFELLGAIGKGGMGVVFRARDTNLGREVALKLLNLSGERAEAAVLHEAKCLARLSHPNVVALYDTGKVGADLFLTMEFVRGMDGRTLLTRFSSTWQEAVEIFVGAGQGLAAAHAAGLEHGDFKPENILISRDRRVRVADFGVARALRDQIEANDDDARNHEDTAGRGTEHYMAPERLQGRRGDARSDQFAFCVALWECLFKSRPYSGETAVALLEAMKTGELRADLPLRRAPRRLRQVIAKGLSPAPADRWPDMQSLLDALGGIRKSGERRRLWMGVAVVAVGLAVGSSLATAAMIEWRVPERAGVVMGDELPPLDRGLEVDDRAPLPPDAGVADVVPEVVALIEADDLDGAYNRWLAGHTSAWITKTPIANEALEIAQAFLQHALLHEHVDFERAIVAARYAMSVAGFASVNFSLDSAEQIEFAALLKECIRLHSPVTRLLGEFSNALDVELTLSCSCDSTDGCRGVGPVEHTCLAGLLPGHEDAVQRHLECAAPILTAFNDCMAAASCRHDRVAVCRASRRRDASTCPRLPKKLQRAFGDCTR